jgi:hypothetical protein
MIIFPPKVFIGDSTQASLENQKGLSSTLIILCLAKRMIDLVLKV